MPLSRWQAAGSAGGAAEACQRRCARMPCAASCLSSAACMRPSLVSPCAPCTYRSAAPASPFPPLCPPTLQEHRGFPGGRRRAGLRGQRPGPVRPRCVGPPATAAGAAAADRPADQPAEDPADHRGRPHWQREEAAAPDHHRQPAAEGEPTFSRCWEGAGGGLLRRGGEGAHAMPANPACGALQWQPAPLCRQPGLLVWRRRSLETTRQPCCPARGEVAAHGAR